MSNTENRETLSFHLKDKIKVQINSMLWENIALHIYFLCCLFLGARFQTPHKYCSFICNTGCLSRSSCLVCVFWLQITSSPSLALLWRVTTTTFQLWHADKISNGVHAQSERPPSTHSYCHEAYVVHLLIHCVKDSLSCDTAIKKRDRCEVCAATRRPKGNQNAPHTQSKSAKIARHVWRPASSLLIKSTSLCPGTFSAQDESEKIGTLIGENPKGCPKSFFSLFGFKLTSPFGG